jgi:uncharacterized protein (TIGR03382 family)
MLLLLVPACALAWGFDGHRRLASKLHEPLPAGSCLREWIAMKQTAALQDMACDPDRWRATDADEWPRHFLDIDWVAPIADYPREWSGAQARLGAYARSNGTVPWRVEEYVAKLVAAFRAQDVTAILETMFVMAHYVTDAFSVLHDTRNSDPNNGLHGRWESDMFAVTSNLNGISALAPTYYGAPGRADPRHNVFDIIIVGNGLVNALVQADTANAGNMAGFYAAVKELTARRWGDALTVLASIVWTAWADAGAPELPGFTATCSRAVPSTDITLVGYPVPGGFTHPPPADGGAPYPFQGKDAGSDVDAGVTEAGPGEPLPAACGCSEVAATAWLPLVLAGWAARRRRR